MERDPVSVLGFSRIISDLKAPLIYVFGFLFFFNQFYVLFFSQRRNQKGDASWPCLSEEH